MNLERKKYYKPIYCYRQTPSIEALYEDIISDLLRDKKITLYESFEDADKKGRSFLCDDDDYGVAILDFTEGHCRLSYKEYEKYEDLKGYFSYCDALKENSNCYRVIKETKQCQDLER